MAMLKEIHRTVLPDGIRLTVELDGEIAYHQEEIENPRRLFFDLKGVKAAAASAGRVPEVRRRRREGSAAGPASAEHHARWWSISTACRATPSTRSTGPTGS